MPLKTLVKVGSITNLSDARYCAGMGVDFLGFRVIEGQENFTSPKQYQEIRGWVTGPQIVAEVYGIQTPEDLAAIQENYRPDYLELGLAELHRIGSSITLPIILTLNPGETLPHNILTPAYLLVPEKTDHLEKLVPDFEVLVTVTTAGELEEALGMTGITGVALSGGKEIRPGLKDYDDLAGILESLETDD
jgi:phosphoribosylanthranilate isomerase